MRPRCRPIATEPSARRGHARRAAARFAGVERPRGARSPTAPSGSASSSSSRRSSSTARCSSGWGRPPTSSARRCTTSTTRAGARWRCGPRARRRSCGPSCSTGRRCPWKVWYVAPNFRYERPQKGRYRQHWQVGAEVLGVDDPDVDVEVIALAYGFYRDLGLERVSLLAQLDGRRRRAGRRTSPRCARTSLDHGGALGDEFRGAGRREPAPRARRQARGLAGRHRAGAAAHRAPERRRARAFRGVQRGLDALGIAYELAPRLVRGFDYYTSTTFEFPSDALDAAQNAIGGGGRYDRLAEEMGGPPTPGHRLRDRHRARCCIACDAEGVAPDARAGGRRVRRRRRSAPRAPPRSRARRTSSARRACGPSAPYGDRS